MGVDEGGGGAVLGQGVGQQVIAAAVDGLLGHNVVARLSQGLNGVGDGGSAGGSRQSGYAALQSRDALFQHILGRVGQPSVDVAGVRQTKPGGGMG